MLTAALAIVLAGAVFAGLALALAGRLRAELTLALANLIYVVLLVGGGLVVPLEPLSRRPATRDHAAADGRARRESCARPPGVAPRLAAARAGGLGRDRGGAAWRGFRWIVLTAPPTARPVRGARSLRIGSVASLVANIGIVVTGGVVRLTSSGMGCPTWPRCTEDSYVSHPELGIHGAIEFGNRLLTFVLIAVALLTFVAALRYRDGTGKRRDLRWLAAGMALGIPAQAVIGGISVWTQLNPFVVALHFIVSMVLIALSVWLIRKVWSIPGRPAGPNRLAP